MTRNVYHLQSIMHVKALDASDESISRLTTAVTV